MSGYDESREPPGEEILARHRTALARLIECWQTGDVRAMERLLAADATSVGDGAGEFYAARVAVVGREKVALFLSNIAPDPAEVRLEERLLNGLPTLVFDWPKAPEGFAPRWTFHLEVDADGSVRHTRAVLATRKLAYLD